MAFKTIVRRARFQATPWPSQAMQAIAQRFIDSQNARWRAGRNIYDVPTAPLAAGYKAWKERKYGSGIRDMKKTGRTVRGNRVLRASPGRSTAGNYDTVAQARISLNRTAGMWGISPSDRVNIEQEATVQRKRNRLIQITQK